MGEIHSRPNRPHYVLPTHERLAGELEAQADKAPGLHPYVPPAGVMGDAQGTPLAMDAYYGHSSTAPPPQGASSFEEGIGFLGYAYLSQLSMRAEYRNIVETRARESVRRWLRITGGMGEGISERIQRLERAMRRFKIRELFADMARMDGYFGLGHLYIDLKTAQDDEERSTRLYVVPEKIQKGDLLGFRRVEPAWTTPCDYNVTDPLAEDYYVPSSWWVQGRRVHASRLLTFVGNPVPDMLRPAYNFGGVALAQMCKPYVDNWLRTRQSVSDMLHSFSVMVLKTDLGQLLQDGSCQKLTRRAAMSNAYRDSRGLQVIDRETEEFTNVSAPLTGLDRLQAQSQEHMASVAGVPLVKLLGITPSGLNASSDGEIRCFYDTISAFQESFFAPALRSVLDILQLNEFGDIDPDIGFEFISLWQMDEKERMANMKLQAEIRSRDIRNGLISLEEARQCLASELETPYRGIDFNEFSPSSETES